MLSRLRLARLRRGLTITELADRVGLDPSDLSKIERLQRPLSPRGAKALEKVFGKKIQSLLRAA